jgi:predicted DNA-binding protein with PD1-like motif
MKYAALDNHTYALRLEIGESVHTVLEAFCAEHKIGAASVQGIGSFESPTLAHYSVKTKKYSEHVVPGVLEVTSLLGNVSVMDGSPLVHLHATVAGPDMLAHAGHLAQGVCSATLELIVTAFDATLSKVKSEQVGLNLWDF